jgi:predicted Zn-dependent protease
VSWSQKLKSSVSHFLRGVVALAGLLIASGLQADRISLPEMGDSSARVLTPAQEHQIGTEFLRRIRQAYALVDDPEITGYLRNLGERLVSHSDNPAQPFTFFMIEDQSINAFAAPGGFIGVNAGLVLAAESESELASVLAHEIAHITQHHLARAYEAAEKLNIPALAGIIAAILIGSQNSEAGQATLAATQAGALQAQLNFTRSNENEADFLGIQTLADAGYDPRAMAVFFERLQQASRYYSRPPEFLSTHPVTVNRIANARDRAGDYRYRQVPDSLDFLLIREKLRIRLTPPGKLLEHYTNVLKTGQYQSETAARYGYALTLLKADKFRQARTQIDWLLAQHPEQRHFLLLDADYLMASRQHGDSLARYQQALKIYPDDYALTVNYATALLELGKSQQGMKLLHDYLRDHAADADLYKLQARAEGDAGHTAEAYLSMAEYHFLNGQTNTAIEQLDRALQIDDLDFYMSSRLEARRQELLQIRKLENSSD